MEDIILKKVKFYDSIISTALDSDGIIYVDIYQIAKEIGLGTTQANLQVELCKNDIFLHQGYRYFAPGTFKTKYETNCLDLSYVTAWLSRIVIYRGVLERSPEIADSLIRFQKELEKVIEGSYKNVFIKTNDEIIQSKKRGRPCNKDTQLLNEINLIHQRVDSLYFGFNKFTQFMESWSKDMQTMMDMHTLVMNNISYFTNKEKKKWKNHIYELIDKLVKPNGTYDSRTDVMQYIYMYMTKNYGICWDQEYKDFMRENNSSIKPTTIDVICQNEMYRSIFESILEDTISEMGITLETEDEHEENEIIDNDKYAHIHAIIAPLAELYNDGSWGYNSTYKKVYKQMSEKYKVSWSNHMTRYMKENGVTKFTSKRDLIISKHSLLDKFEKTVKDMIEECTNKTEEKTDTEIIIIEQ